MTVFEALVGALRGASEYNRADQTRPAAVVWTDKERQWECLATRLRAELPLLTLGPYDPGQRTGPAIWLRCMIARTLPEADWAGEVTPILYLPGISRQELRAVEGCPRALQPLAELQYRGVLWTHKNGRDWTVSGFLQSADGGLGVGLASDAGTREALQRSLPRLADMPVADLKADAPLNASRLNALLNPEPVRNLLRWLDDPAGWRKAQGPAEWEAFRAICREQYDFDPDTDGEITAAELLGRREGAWESPWNRFAEAPRRYTAIPELLRRAPPQKADDLFHDPSSWPQENEARENELRDRLGTLKAMQPADAREALRGLEKAHAPRCAWVWAELGQAPLARALQRLIALADATETPLGGGTPQEIAAAYAGGGWKADDAALGALASVERAPDVAAVRHAVETLYQPWLRQAAETFQRAVAAHPLPVASPPPAAGGPPAGRCLLFADGLRYDVGQRLAEALEASGFAVARGWRFGALPGVTATAKPAVSPVAPLLEPGPEFSARVAAYGAEVTVEVLRRELTKSGYEVLPGDETGAASGAGWTEFGSLDSQGHVAGWKLAYRIADEVRALAERVSALLEAGWKEVCVLTDHGWLLLPGGLPKAELPLHLTEARKGRCARLKALADTDQQTVPWRWDEGVRIAVAPGIHSYTAGKEYEHGGLSPQECVVPILTVTASTPTGPAVVIADVRWTGLRCRMQISGARPGLVVDLRTKAADASTSLAAASKTVGADGQASLVVPDDSREGEAVFVVVLDGGQVIAQQHTAVGG